MTDKGPGTAVIPNPSERLTTCRTRSAEKT